ncbi:hypothetical protein [Stenotrophomonas bentonitica]|uniref:hypothetical protein n=1 Tax=Stenotrophomonas bentonitica TaxID=1450134 RepID=UPI000C998A9C|nr:hypothetical protein [Stenotrophomonas bentonitica]
MTSIHVKPLFDTPTRQQKETESRAIAADLERFRKAGGRIEILGTTPIDKTGISRWQVVEGGADRRKAAKGEKA